MRRIEVEFGLTISDVLPGELAPLLDSLARLAQNGKMTMSPETERVLRAAAPLALAAAPVAWRNGQPKLTEAKVIAALTAWQGNMAKAAKALRASPSGLYQFCQQHEIAPASFRAKTKETHS